MNYEPHSELTGASGLLREFWTKKWKNDQNVNFKGFCYITQKRAFFEHTKFAQKSRGSCKFWMRLIIRPNVLQILLKNLLELLFWFLASKKFFFNFLSWLWIFLTIFVKGQNGQVIVLLPPSPQYMNFLTVKNFK